jgi:hypothetical protein
VQFLEIALCSFKAQLLQMTLLSLIKAQLLVMTMLAHFKAQFLKITLLSFKGTASQDHTAVL